MSDMRREAARRQKSQKMDDVIFGWLHKLYVSGDLPTKPGIYTTIGR